MSINVALCLVILVGLVIVGKSSLLSKVSKKYCVFYVLMILIDQNYDPFQLIPIDNLCLVFSIASRKVSSVLFGSLYMLPTITCLLLLINNSINTDSTSFSRNISRSFLLLNFNPSFINIAVPPLLVCCLLLAINVYPGIFIKFSVFLF